MYNPVNMKIEDEDRLLEKDARDKSKKQRYGVRYDVEDVVRRECLADFERAQDMALRKISHKRDEEQVNRGFNILTNGELPTALAIMKDEKQTYAKKPPVNWKKMTGEASESTMKKVVTTTASNADSNVELKGTNFGNRVERHINLVKGGAQSASGLAEKRPIRSGGF